MKNKNISRACLAAALVMAGTVSAHASALRSSAPETEAAVMIMDNTRMARPKAKIVKEYAPTNRPAEAERLFRSEAVEAEIARIKGVLSNAKLAWMFENCFPNTLDTTVRYRKDDNGKDDTVVYTGDIHAMWLRDSGAQVWPYLQLANKDEHLRSMLAGVIRRQFKCIELDPYANAFLDPYDPNPDHQWMSDQTQMRPELHERKWEIDSLCYPLRLAYEYWLVTGDDSVFDEHWMAAIRNILKTFREQQRKEGVGPYTFMRVTDRQLDTVCNMGKGNPVNPVGLIASVFRPSDDATTFLFLVPSNFFAVTSLRKAAEILTKVNGQAALAAECTELAAEVETALKKYATYNHPEYGTIYAFEVDGYGNRFLMDDANVPSLLAMPYLGDMDVNDPIYQNTRRFVWSEANPYFFRGSAGEGIGGHQRAHRRRRLHHDQVVHRRHGVDLTGEVRRGGRQVHQRGSRSRRRDEPLVAEVQVLQRRSGGGERHHDVRRGGIGHSGEAGVSQAPLHGPDERRGSHVGVRLRHYLSPFTLRAMRSATDRFSRLSWPQNTTASISAPT